MRCIFNKIIEKGSAKDRKLLLSLNKRIINKKPNPYYIGAGVSVVYIYSLDDRYINYPNKDGNVIYIGEACGQKKPTGNRFSQHISHKQYQGGNYNVNYCLNSYYWNGTKLRLKIYKTSENENRKNIEKELIKCHVKIYGTTPIGQGTTNYKINDINKTDTSIYGIYFQNKITLKKISL